MNSPEPEQIKKSRMDAGLTQTQAATRNLFVNNKPRGGYRKHAGRPVGTTKPDKRQSLTIRLPPDLIAALKQIPRQGRFIEAAIRAALNSEN